MTKDQVQIKLVEARGEVTRLKAIVDDQQDKLNDQKSELESYDKLQAIVADQQRQLQQSQASIQSILRINAQYLTIMENMSYGITKETTAGRQGRETD